MMTTAAEMNEKETGRAGAGRGGNGKFGHRSTRRCPLQQTWGVLAERTVTKLYWYVRVNKWPWWSTNTQFDTAYNQYPVATAIRCVYIDRLWTVKYTDSYRTPRIGLTILTVDDAEIHHAISILTAAVTVNGREQKLEINQTHTSWQIDACSTFFAHRFYSLYIATRGQQVTAIRACKESPDI